MLRGIAKSGNKQKDFRSLGLLMVRLMERSTNLQSPDSLELQNPEKWDDSIKNFLKETAWSPGEVLQEVGNIGAKRSTSLTA